MYLDRFWQMAWPLIMVGTLALMGKDMFGQGRALHDVLFTLALAGMSMSGVIAAISAAIHYIADRAGGRWDVDIENGTGIVAAQAFWLGAAMLCLLAYETSSIIAIVSLGALAVFVAFLGLGLGNEYAYETHWVPQALLTPTGALLGYFAFFDYGGLACVAVLSVCVVLQWLWILWPLLWRQLKQHGNTAPPMCVV